MDRRAWWTSERVRQDRRDLLACTHASLSNLEDKTRAFP